MMIVQPESRATIRAKFEDVCFRNGSVDELIRAMDPAMHKRMMKYAPIFLLHTEYVVHPISPVLPCSMYQWLILFLFPYSKGPVTTRFGGRI